MNQRDTDRCLGRATVSPADVKVSAELSPRFGSDLRAVDPAAYRVALAAGADTSDLSAIWARVDR